MEESEKRKTQLVIVTGFIFLFFLLKVKALIYTAFLLALLFLFLPPVGNVVLKVWFALAEISGWINTRILLSLLFFVFLVPISFFYRMLNRDPLFLKQENRTSFFHDRNYTYAAKDLENMW